MILFIYHKPRFKQKEKLIQAIKNELRKLLREAVYKSGQTFLDHS